MKNKALNSYTLQDYDSIKDTSFRMKTPLGLNKIYMNQMKMPSDYENQIGFLKRQYDNRLQALHEQIAKMHEVISQDEILSTMKGNETSKAYMGQRIKEIVDENITAEREVQIQQLMQDLTFTQIEKSKLEKSLQVAELERNELHRLIEEMEREKGECEQHNVILEEQVNKLQNEIKEANAQFELIMKTAQNEAREMSTQHQENYTAIKRESLILEQRLENSLRELEVSRREAEETSKGIERFKRKYKMLEDEYNVLSEENARLKETESKVEEEAKILKSLNFECSLRLKQLNEEKKQAEDNAKKAIQEKDELLEKFNCYGDQLQKSNAETLEAILAKHKEKRIKFQKKIIELKEIISKREEELLQQKKAMQGLKEVYENTITELHEDIKRVRDEWEHKTYEQKIEYQRQLAEEQSRSALQISHLNEEYQQALEGRIAEIQEEAQTQIDKAKVAQTEIQALFEERMRNIEMSYVPMKDYEEAMEMEKKKHKEVLEKLRSKEELKDVEMMEKNYRERIKKLESEERKTIEALQLRLDELEEEKAKLMQTNKKLNKQIEEMEESLEELKNEKELDNELEARLKVNKENTKLLIERYEQANTTATKMTTEVELLKHKLQDTLEEGEKKIKKMNIENEQLKNMIRQLEQDKQLVMESKYSNSMQRENERLEKEIKDHMETKNCLYQAESKLKIVEQELEQLQEVFQENEIKIVELEEIVSNTKGQLYELETKARITESELQNSLIRFKNFNGIYKKLHKNLLKLKEKHNGLKELTNNEITKTQNKVINTIKKLEVEWSKKSINAIQREKNLLKKELHDTVKSKEKEYSEQSSSMNSKYDEMIREKNKQITQLEKVCDNTRQKNHQLFNSLNELQSLLTIKESEAIKLQKENERLSNEVKLNNEKLLVIKSEVKDQTAKLKIDAENTLIAAKQDLDIKYKMKLVYLKKEIELLKHEATKQLTSLLGVFNNLRMQHQYEMEHRNQAFEHKLNEMNYLLTIEKEKAQKYKQEADKLQQDMDSLKEQQILKLKHLNDSLNLEANRYKQQVREEFNKKLNEVTAELNLKIEETKEQRIKIEDIELQNSKQVAEHIKVLANKEKEIEELHKLLFKSYNSASSSLDSVKLASKLQAETNELAKKVKEASFGMKSHKESTRGKVLNESDSSNKHKPFLSMSQLDPSPTTNKF